MNGWGCGLGINSEPRPRRQHRQQQQLQTPLLIVSLSYFSQPDHCLTTCLCVSISNDFFLSLPFCPKPRGKNIFFGHNTDNSSGGFDISACSSPSGSWKNCRLLKRTKSLEIQCRVQPFQSQKSRVFLLLLSQRENFCTPMQGWIQNVRSISVLS